MMSTEFADVDIIESIRTQKIRDHFDNSLQKSLTKNGLSTTRREITSRDLANMKKFMSRELTYSQMLELVEEYGEKPLITNFFSGNRFEFESHMKSLKSIEEDMEKASYGESARVVSEELGKELLNDEESTQLRCHSSHLNRGLGDNAGFVSRNNRGYVWQLFADGYLKDISPEGVQQLVAQRYGYVVSMDEATSIATDMNHDRRVYEGSTLQGKIGDSPATVDAVSIITNEGMKKQLSYEFTELLGSDARKITSKFDHEFGKIVGEAKVNGATDKVKARLARFFQNSIQSLNMDTDDILALVEKASQKK